MRIQTGANSYVEGDVGKFRLVGVDHPVVGHVGGEPYRLRCNHCAEGTIRRGVPVYLTLVDFCSHGKEPCDICDKILDQVWLDQATKP